MINRNHMRRCLTMMALVLAPWSHAATVVVTFEEPEAEVLADGYGGISGWQSGGGSRRENRWIPGGQEQFAYGGFNSAPDDGVGIDDEQAGLHFVAGPVVFEGAYFFNADMPAGVQTGILLYYQGQLVHRVADPMASELTWVSSGYHGLVDTLYFAAGYDGFMLDNLTYTTATTVPEPAGALLWVGGLVVLAARGRRLRQAVDGRMTQGLGEA